MLELSRATDFNHGSAQSQYFLWMNTLAERIEIIMAETGHTLQDLADMAGVTFQAVSQWKLGATKNIRMEPLFKLARGCGYSAEWIATGEGPPRVIAVKHPEYIIDIEPLSEDQRIVIRAAVDASTKHRAECG